MWRRVLRDQAPGVIKAAHRDVLRAYCEALAHYNEAVRLYAASGPLIPQGDTFITNPLHRIVRDNRDQVRLFARELGLTPSALSGLRGDERTTDSFEDYLNRGRRRPAG